MKSVFLAVLVAMLMMAYQKVVLAEQIDHYVPAEKNLDPAWVKSLFAKGERKVYRGKELETIGMPCGGICAGQLYVRGDGTLAQWWIANNAYGTAWWWTPKQPEQLKEVKFDTPLGEYRAAYRTYRPPSYIDQGVAIRVKTKGGKSQVRTLDRDGFDDIGFIGEYPIATIQYDVKEKPELPVSIKAEVFSPFIPLNARDSANPATILRYTVANTSNEPVDVSLAGWLQNAVCWGSRDKVTAQSRNRIVRYEKLTSAHLKVEPHPSLRDLAEFGDMALTLMDREASATVSCPSKQALLADLADDGELSGLQKTEYRLGQKRLSVLATSFTLKPNESKNATFLLTWYFPNRHQDNCGGGMAKRCGVGKRVGNMYGNWFNSSLDVAKYIATNFQRLDQDTHLFRDTYYDTTLPYWLVHRIAMPVSTLATETCQWWANGRFWAWEGVGACHGTCGHVWHYEQAMPRLFPELSRSVRDMQDFNPEEGFDAKTGAIAFRGKGGAPAGDSQPAYILMAYREHLMSVDDAFLQRNWPNIRKALEYLIRQDGNADGLIEGRQHNTYDISFYGANTMIGSLYLAALRAGEEMALLMGKRGYATKCRSIYESGRKLTSEKLFNGEYFIQQVDLKKYPKYQYANGCLSDQVIGQSWAHQVGLGYLYPREQVISALQSVWKYNWAPDVGPHTRVHQPEIVYADPGEAGLLLCTWPKSKHPGYDGVRYRNTVWTGIEAQVAGHMLYEGMEKEGLAIIRGIHERYDGAKHNPWNQILCGDHYARAMASWGCLVGLSGLLYDGPAGKIGFAPRLNPDNFKVFFTAAEGWGSLMQQRNSNTQVNSIDVKWGQLRVETMSFELPEVARIVRVKVLPGERQVNCYFRTRGKQVLVELEQPLLVKPHNSIQTISSW